MKITNKTDWSSADLRRVFSAVLKKWNATEVPRRQVNTKRLKISVVNTRWRGMSGCAYLNSGLMTIRLPRLDEESLDTRKVAYLFEHELSHCAGYKHISMGALNNWKLAKTDRYDYIAEAPIGKNPVKAPKLKLKKDVQIVRYQRATAAMARWQTKLKRATTGVKAAKAKVRYYEKALSADGRLAALKGTKP